MDLNKITLQQVYHFLAINLSTFCYFTGYCVVSVSVFSVIASALYNQTFSFHNETLLSLLLGDFVFQVLIL